MCIVSRIAADPKGSMNVAKHYQKFILGVVLIAALAAGLVWWIGLDVIADYQDDLQYYVIAHLSLVGRSMVLALFTGIPAGIVLSRPLFSKQAERVMQIFNVGNTLPSLAVLALSMAVLGIGDRPAVLALWLASLLPIVRNTFEGLRQVSPALRESARGMGMTPLQSLFKVELPNAMPVIMGGVRTALVINVGTAPLAFLIGATSLGALIFPGIYLNDQSQLLLGAGGTALLAIVLDGLVAFGSQLMFERRGLSR